jgi:hypothetical protein
MAHTLPDGTTKYRMVTIFGQIDSGELAARLGSIDYFDRRGNVIWLDDFEAAVLHWEITAGGGGGRADLNATAALSGNQSCLVQSGTTTADPTKMIRGLAFTTLGKIGFEIANTFAATINDLTWRMVVYDGTYLHIAKIAWNNGLDRLYYWDETNTQTELAQNVSMTMYTNGFNNIKLVADFSTGYYTRFIFNNTVYPMSSYKVFKTPSGTGPRIRLEFWVDGVFGQNAEVYVDNVIATQNES